MDVEDLEMGHLLERCVQNDRISQARVFQLLEHFALQVCYRYHSDRDEIADITSESFLKLFRNLDSFDMSRCNDIAIGLKAWFKRIIVNTCIDHLRKRPAHKILSTNSKEVEIPETRENGYDRLGYKEIIHSIQKLSPAYRTVFNLHVIDGMKHEEIAGMLGISVGASKSNLFKARDQLKKILERRSTRQTDISRI